MRALRPSTPEAGCPSFRAANGRFAWFRHLAGLLDRLEQHRLLVFGVEQRQSDVPASVPFAAVDAASLVGIKKAGYGVRPLAEKQGYVLTETRPVRGLRVRPGTAARPEMADVARILRLHPALDFYEVELSPGGQIRPTDPAEQRTKRTVTTRSLLEVTYFLSHAVGVPPEHAAKGLVTVTLNPDGTPFDWGQVTGDLLRVCAARHQPKWAVVAVHYRGYWYYIDDADVASKTTRALFRELTRLQRIGAAEGQPLLTLPVGWWPQADDGTPSARNGPAARKRATAAGGGDTVRLAPDNGWCRRSSAPAAARRP